MNKIKKFLDRMKYKYSPTIPGLDYLNKESRKNWILYMAHKTGKMPVREIYDRIVPHVSKMTVNTDFQELEKEHLIKRIKENHGTKQQASYVLPLFDDSGEKEPSESEKRRDFLLNFGLPTINIVLIVILFAILSAS